LQAEGLIETACNANRKAFEDILKAVSRCNPSVLVHLGDVTGGYQECGTIYDAEKVARQTVAQLNLDGRQVYYSLRNF